MSVRQALLHYQKARDFVPDFPDALAGERKVKERYQKKFDDAIEHYVKGSRARGEDHHQQSKYHNEIAIEKDPSLTKAEQRRRESSRLLANERYDRAKAMEEKGFYGAALMEYEAIVRVIPDAPELKERVAAMQKEVEAAGMRRNAEMEMRRSNFDEAEKLLDSAYEVSRHQRADLSALMLDNKQRRWEERYRKAKDLELEYEFEAALEVFREIDKAWKKGFLDVKTRISGLEGAIEEAGKLLAAGQKHEAAGDLKKAIEAYEDALSHYPGYKGLDKRVKELRGKARN